MKFKSKLYKRSLFLALAMQTMAGGTKWLLSCFFVLFLFIQVFAEGALDSSLGIKDAKIGVAAIHRIPHGPRINCNFSCARRCRKASRKKICAQACHTCCMKCHCVPAGTYGNKNSCPCYASLRTHGKKPKCP